MFLKSTYLTLKDLEEFPPQYIRFGVIRMKYLYMHLPPQPVLQYMLNLPVLLQKKDNFVGSNLKIKTFHSLCASKVYNYLDQLINGVFGQCTSISIKQITINEKCGNKLEIYFYR